MAAYATPTPEKIPSDLIALPQWVVWRLTKRDSTKSTKVPYRPKQPKVMADTTKPETWGTFQEAWAAYKDLYNELDGVGFVFTEKDDFVGIDFDSHDSATRSPNDQARRDLIFAQAVSVHSYVERSPSGKGFHLIIRGRMHGRGLNDHGAGVEMYDRNRYFTVTGLIENGFNAITQQQNLVDFIEQHLRGSTGEGAEEGRDRRRPPPAEGRLRALGLSDQEVLDRANKIDPKTFQSIYDGHHRNGPGEWSDSFFSLLCSLDYITGDQQQVYSLIIRSPFVTNSPPASGGEPRLTKARRTFVDTYWAARDINTPNLEEAAVNQERAERAMREAEKTVDEIADRLSVHATELLKAYPIRAEYLKLCHPPGYMAEFVKATERAMRMPFLKYALPATLTVFSGLLGRRYKQFDGDGINIMTVLAAPTTTGKTQTMNAWKRFLDEAVVTAQAQPQNKFHPVRSPLITASTSSIQGIYQDLMDRPNAVWFIEEAAAQIKQLTEAKTVVDIQFKDAFNALHGAAAIGETFTAPRSVANRKAGYEDIHNLCVAPYWTLPESKFDVFTQDALDGYLSRIICIVHRGEAGKRVPELEVVRRLSPREHGALVILLGLVAKTNFAYNNAEHDRAMLTNVTQSELVIIDYREIYHLIEQMESIGENIKNRALRKEIPQVYTVVSRLSMNAKRIAGTLAVLDNPYLPVVTTDHYEWAIGYCLLALVELLSDMDKGEIGEAASDNYLTVKRAVRELLKKNKGGVPKTLLRRVIQNRKPFQGDPRVSQLITHTLEQMQKDGLFVVKVESTGLQGRPTQLVLPTNDAFWKD